MDESMPSIVGCPDIIINTSICMKNTTSPNQCKLYSVYTVDSEFRDNFIFAKSIKRHISNVKNLRIRQDLPISIYERMILPFREGFISTKLREVSRK